MRALKLIMITLFLSGAIRSQVSVNVNIGSPPLWGPVGYTEVQYYYLPDVEAYYDVQTSMFIYYGSGVWIRRAYLPKRYRYYDLYSGYKVVLTDYSGSDPYIHFKNHKVKYYKGYKGGAQKTIGENPRKRNNKSISPSNNGVTKKSHRVNDNGSGQKKGNKVSHNNEKNGGGKGRSDNHSGVGKKK